MLVFVADSCDRVRRPRRTSDRQYGDPGVALWQLEDPGKQQPQRPDRSDAGVGSDGVHLDRGGDQPRHWRQHPGRRWKPGSMNTSARRSNRNAVLCKRSSPRRNKSGITAHANNLTSSPSSHEPMVEVSISRSLFLALVPYPFVDEALVDAFAGARRDEAVTQRMVSADNLPFRTGQRPLQVIVGLVPSQRGEFREARRTARPRAGPSGSLLVAPRSKPRLAAPLLAMRHFFRMTEEIRATRMPINPGTEDHHQRRGHRDAPLCSSATLSLFLVDHDCAASEIHVRDAQGQQFALASARVCCGRQDRIIQPWAACCRT